MISHETRGANDVQEGAVAIRRTSSEVRLPDFIIGGAMKCATTTLHHALGRHPRVFIPRGEVKFFDLDEIELHPDNFGRVEEEWSVRNFDRDYEQSIEWYRKHFAPGAGKAAIGEDSPSYLCSERAPARIRHLLPNVKLIFLLRDPVERAYSHYWHWVRSGRAFFDFEDTLRHSPGTILRRGLYKRQLERYFEVFPRRQIKVLLYEQFVGDLRGSIAAIEDYLGLPHETPESAFETQSNAGLIPRNLNWKLRANWHLRRQIGRVHQRRLPGEARFNRYSYWEKLWLQWNKRINPCTPERPPPMKESTRRFLAEYYAAENEGLSELINIDVKKYWRSARHDSNSASEMTAEADFDANELAESEQ